MKLFFISLIFTAISSLSYAQGQVVDTHPGASIFIIDFTSGQLVKGESDGAILFKDAFLELCENTYIARVVSQRYPALDNRVVTITQMDPQSNINGYQLVLQNNFSDRTITVYTFLFNVDEQKLYFYNPRIKNYQPQTIQYNNSVNMQRCIDNSRFNDPNGQGNVDASVDINAPVDTNISANTAPPPIPEYEQPECPTEGYLWQPGFWAYSPIRNDYYWVPGSWVAPPQTGVYWTPPYWGFFGGAYVFHTGYWGPQIGFYGGINYGFGYGGVGFGGGEWRDGNFRYNTAVVRVNTTVIHNTYVNTTVINHTTINNRTSFNGPGGVEAKPTPKEIAATKEEHIKPTSAQIRNQNIARVDKKQFASANPGNKPANLAAAKVPEKLPANITPFKNPKSTVNNNKPGLKAPPVAKPAVAPVNPAVTPKPAITPPNRMKPANTKQPVNSRSVKKPQLKTKPKPVAPHVQ